MKYVIYLLVALGLFAPARAGMAQQDEQPQPGEPSQPDELPVELAVDNAAFAYTDDTSLLEIYLAFDASSLTFEKDSAMFRTRLPIDLAVVRSTEAELASTPTDPVWADSIFVQFAIPDTSGLAPGQHFVHQFRTAVPPGEYELQVAIPEDSLGSRQRLEVRRDLVVPDYAGNDQPVLSDVTLASTIQRGDDERNPFYKNGLIIRPNANQLYGVGLPQVYYYAEAYHTGALTGRDDQYTVYTYISETNRPQPVAGLEKRTPREAHSPDVLVGSFPIDSLPSGSYYLHLALLDEQNEAVVEQARKFFVYNPDVQRAQPVAMEESFESSPYAAMPEEEVETMLKQISIIANSTERRRIDRLADLDTKRRFLMDFWKKRDPSPTRPGNEYRDEFMRLVHYANERFSSSYMEGWETDRGRTLLKYGRPSNIDPRLYEQDTVPHIVWEYNNIPGEGRGMFVFADREGFGRFELLHSTVTGERNMPNWQEMLRR